MINKLDNIQKKYIRKVLIRKNKQILRIKKDQNKEGIEYYTNVDKIIQKRYAYKYHLSLIF